LKPKKNISRQGKLIVFFVFSKAPKLYNEIDDLNSLKKEVADHINYLNVSGDKKTTP